MASHKFEAIFGEKHVSDDRYKNFCPSTFDFIPLRNDVVLSAFPKCGITWTEHIVWSIFHQGEGFPSERSLHDECPRLELVGKEVVEKLTTNPRIIKTHLPFSHLQKNPEAKFVFVVRNPKDTLVSRYHHCRGFGTCQTLDPLFRDFIREKEGRAGYFNFILDILPHIHDSNVFVVRFEKMRSDPEKEIFKLAAFLDPPNTRWWEEGFIRKVEESTSLKSMKENQSRWMYRDREWMSKDHGFVRKGAVAGWREELSEEQSLAIDRVIEEKFGGTLAQNWFCS